MDGASPEMGPRKRAVEISLLAATKTVKAEVNASSIHRIESRRVSLMGARLGLDSQPRADDLWPLAPKTTLAG